MRIFHSRPLATIGRTAAFAISISSLFGFCSMRLFAQPCSVAHSLTAEQQHILARAREILVKAGVNESEREVRLQVIKAVLTGAVIRPDDDYPEMRNPKFWTLSNDVFVLTPGIAPVDAISDLWAVHEKDGVPIPRIRCYKYSSLALVQGHIQYLRETGNTAGLAELNRLLGRRTIPQGLPNGGDDLLWKRRNGGDGLLPGDQAWVDNPFFERGRKLLRQEAYEQLLREGRPAADAIAEAKNSTDDLIAGEEGSNVFYLGDDKLMRGAFSLCRLCRETFQPGGKGATAAYEQVFTPMIFSLARFQEHMIDDNYSAQACLRAEPASVRAEDFKIERVRAPIGPENLLRLEADAAAGKPAARPVDETVAIRMSVEAPSPAFSPEPPAAKQEPRPLSPYTKIELDKLIDAAASRNRPPRLATAGGAAFPLFDKDYDWAEQRRVRLALEALMRTKSDELWWRLRDNVGDRRYVLTASRNGAVKNFTLGELCSDIVDLRLCLAFTSHLPSVPGRLPPVFRPEREFWLREAEWSRRRERLYAMQAALCEAAIEQFASVRGTLPGSDGLSHVYSADEKARCLAALRKESTERTKAKKALYEEVVVPWLPAPSGWEGFDAQRAREARADYLRKAGLAASAERTR
jgi:hypothetical protein